MTDLKSLFKTNYMVLALQTLVLMFWMFFVFPQITGFFGVAFNSVDPIHMGLMIFSGLLVSIATFKLLKYREGY
jgi:hypothetical protein